MLPPKFIQKFYCNISIEELYLAGFDIDFDSNILVLFLNSSGAFSNFGRIWTILQRNVLGGLEIYYIDKKTSVLPQYKRLFNVTTEEKITFAKYVKSKKKKKHEFYFSLHSGKILKYSFDPKFKSKKVISDFYEALQKNK